jgi:predicted ATPase
MGERRTRSSFAKAIAQNGFFANGKLYGRKEEEETLLKAYRRTRQAPLKSNENNCCNHQLVLISGPPGTGKTSLASTLRYQVVVKDKGFLVSGKFEPMALGQEPYEVFASALTEYTDQFLESSSQARVETLRTAVREAVGPEAGLLTDIFPALKHLLGPTERPTRVYGTEALHRFRFVFCNFIRALSKCAPLVLLLDDLQWADCLSTELLRALFHTPNMALLVIGVHRCNVETTTSSKHSPWQNIRGNITPFAATVQDLEREPTTVIDILKIELNNLNVHDVTILLADSLLKKPEETRFLADVVCIQTSGNVFHVLQLLRLLIDQGLLRQDENEIWQWDDDKLSGRVGSEHTIEDLVRQTIERLPRPLQEALKVASCMGDEIDDSALDLVVLTSTGKYLEQAAEEGLLTFFPQFGGYRFAHSWIRQTAFEMIPEDERDAFYLKIGRRLWKASSPAARDKNIFMIVSLLNKALSIITDERERYKVAELNLRAGEQAIEVVAFSYASRFLKKGIQLLGESRWKDQYDLSLALYSTASEVEFINGNFQRTIEMIKNIFEHGHCIEDKFRAYKSLIRSTAFQENVHEATMIGIDALKQLGEPIPLKATKFTIAVELAKVKMALRGKTNQDLLNLPPMRDKSKIESSEILNLIVFSGYQARGPHTALFCFRSVLLTLKYGLHEGSSVAFALYGAMLCGMGLDFKTGHRFGQLAISLAEDMHAKEMMPMVYFIVGAGINHWTQPSKESLEILEYAANIGIEVGNVDFALMSMHCRSINMACFGLPLRTVEVEVLETMRLAKLHRRKKSVAINSVLLQLLHCWTGRAKNPARLSGSVIDFDEKMTYFLETNNKTWVLSMYFYSMVLAYTFEDYEFAGKMSEGSCDVQKTPAALEITVEIRYMEGLTAAALLRKGRECSKNTKIARSALKQLKKWAKESPRIFTAKHELLEAELLSLKAKVDPSKVYAVYEKAIKAATEEGYTRDAALACEREGDYKKSNGDVDGAIKLWRRAITLYDQWGATEKSEDLRAKALLNEKGVDGNTSRSITTIGDDRSSLITLENIHSTVDSQECES